MPNKNKIQIHSGDYMREDDELLPVVPFVIYEELCRNFDIDSLLLNSKLKNNDERIGYIKGVREVLHRVRILAKIDKE